MNRPLNQTTDQRLETSEDNLKQVDISQGPDPEAADNPKKGDIRQTWDLLITPRMLTLLPLMMWSAMSLAIYSASFVPLMTMGMPKDWSDDKQVQEATLATVALGVGEILGGIVAG